MWLVDLPRCCKGVSVGTWKLSRRELSQFRSFDLGTARICSLRIVTACQVPISNPWLPGCLDTHEGEPTGACSSSVDSRATSVTSPKPDLRSLTVAAQRGPLIAIDYCGCWGACIKLGCFALRLRLIIPLRSILAQTVKVKEGCTITTQEKCNTSVVN